MGRGRQKAKNTKIARELKSFSPTVDYNALERELTGHAHDYEPDYSKWADEYDETESDAEDTDDVEPQQKRA